MTEPDCTKYSNDEMKEDEEDLPSDIEHESEDEDEDEEEDEDGRSMHESAASGSYSDEEDSTLEAQLVYMRQEMVCSLYTHSM